MAWSPERLCAGLFYQLGEGTEFSRVWFSSSCAAPRAAGSLATACRCHLGLRCQAQWFCSRPHQAEVPATAFPHTVRCRHLELRRRAQLLRTQSPRVSPSCGEGRRGSVLGPLLQRVRCKASAHGPLKASETRHSTKEEFRPYHLDSILFFLGTPVGFVGDIYIGHNFCGLVSECFILKIG